MRVWTANLVALLALLPWSLSFAEPASNAWSIWEIENPQNEASISHDAWQRFLDRYVAPHEDGIHRVDYTSAAATGRSLLTKYLREMAAVDPREYSAAEQFAFWVNLYNALTIDIVLRHPDEEGILNMGESLLSRGPWDDQVITIAGEPITLNDIEHRILRPIWQDHRIHFAVNCASLGCPNLATDAFTAANAERLLTAAEAAFLGHSRAVEIVSEDRIRLSSLFEWYLDDFAASEAALVHDYLAKHRSDVASTLKQPSLKIDYVYDWSLNARQPR